MSYSTTLYAVDIEHLQATFGSQDAALLANIERKYAGEIADSNTSFDEEIAEGAPTRQKALREIIDGEITRPDYGFQYGYALEYLCRHLGEIVASRFLNGVFGSLADLEVDTFLAQDRLPLPLPEPDDFPFISYMTPEEITEELQRLAGMDLSYPEDEEIEAERHDFRDCLKKAEAAQLGIVAFYY